MTKPQTANLFRVMLYPGMAVSSWLNYILNELLSEKREEWYVVLASSLTSLPNMRYPVTPIVV